MAAGSFSYKIELKGQSSSKILIRSDDGKVGMELRIDNATLIVTTKPCSVAYNDAANVGVASEEVTLANVAGNLTNLLVYGENYNVLRINIIVHKSYLQHLSGKGAGNQLCVRGLGNNKSTPVASMVHFATMRDYLLREHHKATRYQGNLGKPVPGLEKRTRVWS
jgi:hypothetical protein